MLGFVKICENDSNDPKIPLKNNKETQILELLHNKGMQILRLFASIHRPFLNQGSVFFAWKMSNSDSLHVFILRGHFQKKFWSSSPWGDAINRIPKTDTFLK